MSHITMEELQRGQESLRVEINQLKTQMSWIMEILQAMLRKEDNPTPVAVAKMLTQKDLFKKLYIFSILISDINSVVTSC